MSLTAQQVDYLLRPINRARVLRDDKGHSHLSQQDVRAHLTRIFGFGGWSSEILDLRPVEVLPTKTKPRGEQPGKDAWAVTYLCRMRLTIRDPEGQVIASFDDVGSGTSPNLPSKGDAHDFASKVAVSIALKRCATNLGDGFGLSLYNKGQTDALVVGTLVRPGAESAEVDDAALPAQESLGHDDEGSRAEEAGPPVSVPTDRSGWDAEAYLMAMRASASLPELIGLHRDAMFAGLGESTLRVSLSKGADPEDVTLDRLFDLRLDWVRSRVQS